MSSSGKGQSVVRNAKDVRAAWDFAVAGMIGDKRKLIVEEFIKFESEITLLTVKQKKGPTILVNPSAIDKSVAITKNRGCPHQCRRVNF